MLYKLLYTLFKVLDQITCYKEIKLFLEVSKANTCLATAHSSVSLQVTGAFCILITALRANSPVTHFCPKSSIASWSLFNARQHRRSSTKSFVTFPFLAQAGSPIFSLLLSMWNVSPIRSAVQLYCCSTHLKFCSRGTITIRKFTVYRKCQHVLT